MNDVVNIPVEEALEALHLPIQINLPNELEVMILHEYCLMDKRNAKQVSLLSKWTRTMALPYFYTSVEVHMDSTSHAERFWGLVRRDKNGQCSRVIKKLEVKMDKYCHETVNVISEAIGMLPNLLCISIRCCRYSTEANNLVRQAKISGAPRPITLYYYDYHVDLEAPVVKSFETLRDPFGVAAGADASLRPLLPNVSRMATFLPWMRLSNTTKIIRTICAQLPNLHTIAFDLNHPMGQGKPTRIPDSSYTAKLERIPAQLTQIILLFNLHRREASNQAEMAHWFTCLRARDPRFLMAWSYHDTKFEPTQKHEVPDEVEDWSNEFHAEKSLWERAITDTAEYEALWAKYVRMRL